MTILLSAQNSGPAPQQNVEPTTASAPFPGSHNCDRAEWKTLNSPLAGSLFSDYGFDEPLGWLCTGVALPWLPGAVLMRLQATRGLDDYREVTLVQASPKSRIWLIPTERGMVGLPHIADDPHHIAAFNDLLRVARYKPSRGKLMDLSDLYQFMVGMDVVAEPNRKTKTLANELQTNDVQWFSESKGNVIDLTHREKFGDRWNRDYMVWQFTYAEKKDYAQLVYVSRQTLASYQEDN